MAARKSCTHLTWAEAKGKQPGGSSSSSSSNTAKGNNVKRENHGKLLAAKIVAKQGPTETEQIRNRQAARLAKRDQQRQLQLEAQRQADKERQRLEAVKHPHDEALERLHSLALSYQTKPASTNNSAAVTSYDDDDHDGDHNDPLRMMMICESKQLQVDEILALQAIFADTPDVVVIAQDCRLEELQTLMEEWDGTTDNDDVDENGNGNTTARMIVQHPPLRLVLQRSVDDPNDEDRVAHCLVQVIFPPSYPIQRTPPHISIEWFLLTQKSLVVAENKPLESLGLLDETKLLQALADEAQPLLGMPTVYELLDTWWNEHIFEFISLHPTIAT